MNQLTAKAKAKIKILHVVIVLVVLGVGLFCGGFYNYPVSQVEFRQIAGQVTVPIAFAQFPNFPFYVFVLFLIVNACFITKLLMSKETK